MFKKVCNNNVKAAQREINVIVFRKPLHAFKA